MTDHIAVRKAYLRRNIDDALAIAAAHMRDRVVYDADMVKLAYTYLTNVHKGKCQPAIFAQSYRLGLWTKIERLAATSQHCGKLYPTQIEMAKQMVGTDSIIFVLDYSHVATSATNLRCVALLRLTTKTPKGEPSAETSALVLEVAKWQIAVLGAPGIPDAQAVAEKMLKECEADRIKLDEAYANQGFLADVYVACAKYSLLATLADDAPDKPMPCYVVSSGSSQVKLERLPLALLEKYTDKKDDPLCSSYVTAFGLAKKARKAHEIVFIVLRYGEGPTATVSHVWVETFNVKELMAQADLPKEESLVVPEPAPAVKQEPIELAVKPEPIEPGVKPEPTVKSEPED